MAELKTQPTDQDVDRFLNAIPDAAMRQDCLALRDLMQQVTRAKPRLWGSSIVGFGQYHYKYASGREGDWFLAGFAPRKRNLTLYLMGGWDPQLLQALGKHTAGKGCLYVRRLDDLHLPTLKKLIRHAARRKAAASD